MKKKRSKKVNTKPAALPAKKSSKECMRELRAKRKERGLVVFQTTTTPEIALKAKRYIAREMKKADVQLNGANNARR